MVAERRGTERVKFGQGLSVRIMGLDGKWRRRCMMEDVSDVGAKLIVDGSLDGLDLTQFFLVLSTIGQAHRRCEKVWVEGNKIGVRFLKPKSARGGPRASADAVVN